MANSPNLKDTLIQNGVKSMQTIQLKKNLKDIDNQYGKSQLWAVIWNGEEWNHFFKERDFGLLKEGKTLSIMLDNSAKGKFVRIIPTGEENDIMNQPHNMTATQAQKHFKASLAPQPQYDDLQAVIHRAQMINVSAALLSGAIIPKQEEVVRLAEELRLGAVGKYIREGYEEETNRMKVEDLPF